MLGDGDCVKILHGHRDRVRAIELSPCGTLLFSAGDDSLILKWDVESGEQLKVFRGHTGVVWALAMAQTSPTLYSGSADCTVRAWDTNRGECVRIISEQRGWVRTLVLSCLSLPRSKDGTENMLGDQTNSQSKTEGTIESLYTGSLNWFIEARNTASNQVLHRIPSGVGRLDLIHALAVTEDGQMLFSAGTGCTIRGWDTRTAQCQKILAGHLDTVFAISLTSNERLWSSSGDRTIRAWRLMDCACIQVISTQNVAYSLCLYEDEHTLFSAPIGNGGIAAWEMDKKINLIQRKVMSKFYNMGNNDAMDECGECKVVLEGHEPGENIYAMAMNRDKGQLFSAGGDCTVRIWQVGVPKRWSRSLHSKFPSRFRAAVREVMKLASPFCNQDVHSPRNGNPAVHHQQQSGNLEVTGGTGHEQSNLLQKMHSLEPRLLDDVLHRMASDFIGQR